MERRLVKQGKDALTVTLPAIWTKDKALRAGDNVYIDVEKTNLVIRANSISASREITLDVTGDERSIVWLKTLSKYIGGYDRIIILHNCPQITQEFPKAMLGMIIEEHSSTKTVLKTLITMPERNIDVVIRRTIHMFEQQAALLEGVAKGTVDVKEVKNKEELLDTNINYCLRYINKYHLQIDSYKQFLLCSTIESAGDLVLKIAENIGNNVSLARAIVQIVETYNKYFFTGDLKTMCCKLKECRNGLKRKTFAEGLAFELVETLYNNIGYLMDKD